MASVTCIMFVTNLDCAPDLVKVTILKEAALIQARMA